jgi:FkbM family methyltransferase
MFRAFLEMLSRNRVLRRRLPPRLGGDAVFVSPDSALEFWKWDLDHGSRDLFAFAEEFVKPGHVVWDVGANVGMFTFASAFRAGQSGQVVALEPDLFLVGLLRRSVASMSTERARTTIIPAAVSDSLGIAELHVARRGRSTNHLASSKGSTQAGGVRETVTVLTVALDWLAERFPRPDVLKIDVEGAEANVLQGAENLISGSKPLILCEVSEANADYCTRFFQSHGYDLLDANDRNRGKIDRTVFNTLAVHRS